MGVSSFPILVIRVPPKQFRKIVKNVKVTFKMDRPERFRELLERAWANDFSPFCSFFKEHNACYAPEKGEKKT